MLGKGRKQEGWHSEWSDLWGHSISAQEYSHMGASGALDQNSRLGIRVVKVSIGDSRNIFLCGNDTDHLRGGKELPGLFVSLLNRILDTL